ncbi:MAG: nucleotidyltransferase family protein [Clostridia bacterium]|nr:nucleotidyltransferase family protein [Clostridia bacterium]
MSELTQTEQNFISLLRSALSDRPMECAMSADADVVSILRLAANHKLYHMILSVLPEDVLPEGINRRRELIGQLTSQVQASTAFLELYSAMEQAGFHPLVVKGIVCRALYPQPELRPSSDEDLYVAADEFEPCCAFLKEHGMIPDKTPFTDFGEVGWRNASGMYIELHRDLFECDETRELQEFFSFDSLHTESYNNPYGRSVVSLNHHDHFLYLLLHAYKHFIHSGFGIRQVCDIGLWAQKYGDRINWQKLAAQCDSVKIRQFTAAVLGIARYDLQIEFTVPTEFEAAADYGKPMLKDILCGGIYGSVDTNRQHSATMTLSAVKASQTDEKSGIWKSVFPSREAMERKYPYVKKHPILLPAAWLQRLCSYAKRNATGETKAAKSLAIGKERIELLRLYGIVE